MTAAESRRYPEDDEVLIKPLRVKATPPADDRLEPIRARHAAATPGPYNVRRDGRYGPAHLTAFNAHDFELTVVGTIHTLRPADSVLMARAWQDISDLLVEIDRLEAQLDAIPDVICGHSAYLEDTP